MSYGVTKPCCFATNFLLKLFIFSSINNLADGVNTTCKNNIKFSVDINYKESKISLDIKRESKTKEGGGW